MLVSASIRGRDAGSSQRVRPRSTTGQTELTRSTPESTQVNRRSTEVNSVNSTQVNRRSTEVNSVNVSSVKFKRSELFVRYFLRLLEIREPSSNHRLFTNYIRSIFGAL
ncbi:hypothetical protein HanPI659440_Chr14g0545531 [Helianthus annuus]|nr:hypothetical protein HanPI659440_Chr14g0545531 [Helianthus annuus]